MSQKFCTSETPDDEGEREAVNRTNRQRKRNKKKRREASKRGQ